MIHSTDNCDRIGTTKSGRPIWQCPVCLRKIVADHPADECPGPKPAPPPVVDTACIYRQPPEVLERIPCGTCAKSGRAVSVPIYACRFGNGRACSLVDVGRADVVTCPCGDRVAPELA